MANLIPSYVRIQDLTEANTFNDWKNKTNVVFSDLNTLAGLPAPANLVVNTEFANSVINVLGPAQIQGSKLATNAAIANIVDNTLSGAKLLADSVPFAKLIRTDILITNSMLNLSNNALDGAKIADSSITGAKLATGQLDGNTLTRKSLNVNRMYASQENVLFGLGTISYGNGTWNQAQSEATELLIGAGLVSVANAALTGTVSDGDVRGGRIYWKPNIARNISTTAVTATSNYLEFGASSLTSGLSGHYSNIDGSYTNGTAPVITGRTDYFLGTTINALNNSHILITVQISGSVQSNYGNYGFMLYKIVNSRTTLEGLSSVYPYYTDAGTTRTTVATFNFIDTTGVTGVTYPGTSPVISKFQGANGTSAAGSTTSSNPIAAHNTYSTITYFVRHINGGNGGSFYLNANIISSMTLQEMPV